MKTRTVRWLHYFGIWFGFLFILWGLAQLQSYTLSKDVGVDGVGQINTYEVSPGSIVYVHSDASKKMDTRVIRNDNREMMFTGNGTYYDKHLAAGGPPGGGVGTTVDLWLWPAPGPTNYTVIIKAPSDTSVDYTEADVDYDVSVTVWSPNVPLLVAGFVLIFSVLTMGTVLGIGLFGPGAYRPRPAAGPEAREVPPVRIAGRMGEGPEPVPTTIAPARRPAPPPAPEQEFGPRYDVTPQPEPAMAPAPAKRGEPLWDMAPARVERAAAPPAEPGKPLKRIKCSACGAIIPIYSAERPLRVTCPLCGRQGTLPH